MQTVCSQCGEAMIPGRVTSTNVERVGQTEPQLSFVVSAGVPTSGNPIKAILQGIRSETDYREEACLIRGRVCPRCGRVEFYLDEADLTRASRLAGPAAKR
jgi:ribosomal protein L32